MLYNVILLLLLLLLFIDYSIQPVTWLPLQHVFCLAMLFRFWPGSLGLSGPDIFSMYNVFLVYSFVIVLIVVVIIVIIVVVVVIIISSHLVITYCSYIDIFFSYSSL